MSFFLSEEKSSKIHSVTSPWRVPFSWEEEPGVSKKSFLDCCPTQPDSVEQGFKLRLPPPPPCALQTKDSMKNNGYRKSAGYYEDPFLAALMECTKISVGHRKDAKKEGCPQRRKLVDLSCKHSCDVRDDTIVRFQSNGHHLPFCPPSGRVSSVRTSLKSQQRQVGS